MGESTATSNTNNKDPSKKESCLAGLSIPHLRFAAEYLRTGNATASAIVAGYSPKTAALTGHRLIRNDKISAYVNEVRKELGLKIEDVMLQISYIAFARMDEYLKWDASGKITLYPSNQLSEPQMAAVKQVKRKKTVRKLKDGTKIINESFVFELHDSVKALILLLRHFGCCDNAKTKSETATDVQIVLHPGPYEIDRDPE